MIEQWLVFLLIGGATLLLRAAFVVAGGTQTSGRFEDLRRFVPVAALTALIVPAVLPRDGEPMSARPLAALAAVLVATQSRNMLVPVVVGLGVFWTVGWSLN